MKLISSKWAHFRTCWLSFKKVERWARKGAISNLHFALIHGDYKQRCTAIAGLQKHQDQSSIPLLNDAVEDSVSLVSFAAMEALVSLGQDQPKRFQAKKNCWATKKQRERAFFEHAEQPRRRNKKERSSKEGYNQIKQMTKKPMNTGKWF